MVQIRVSDKGDRLLQWNLLIVQISFKFSEYGISAFSSVQSLSRVRLCDPMNRSTPGLPVHHQLPELPELMSIEPLKPSSYLIFCHSLLLLPPIPPSIRVFSKESTLRMRWPKYWSFCKYIEKIELQGTVVWHQIFSYVQLES